MASKRAGQKTNRRIARVTGGQAKQGERRREIRLPLGIPVFVRGLAQGQQGFAEFTTAWNLSSNGVLVATKHPLEEPVSLDLPFGPFPPKSAAPAYVQSVRATPAWTTQTEAGYLTGLKFSHPLRKLAKKPQSRTRRSW